MNKLAAEEKRDYNQEIHDLMEKEAVDIFEAIARLRIAEAELITELCR